ncbi:MAG: hypothetical protein GEU99_18050 [Luteitalea sp.]|nr:hypothetical protein [Luteitalea sp.]
MTRLVSLGSARVFPCLVAGVLLTLSSTQQHLVARARHAQVTAARGEGSAEDARPTATVADAIAMVRVQSDVSTTGSVAVFSPDGSKFAAVVWRGDLSRNVNVYSLLVFDTEHALRNPRARSTPIFSVDFPGDPDDQSATPIKDLTFLADNRTVVFLGTRHGEPRQVYALDSVSKRLRRLTRHPTEVRSYAMSQDGELQMFSAVASEADENDRARRREREGAFVFDRTMFPNRQPLLTGLLAVQGTMPRQVRQYFLVSSCEGAPASRPRLIFDSRQSRPRARDEKNPVAKAQAPVSVSSLDEDAMLKLIASLTSGPEGRYALLFPYSLRDHPMHPERYRAYESTNALGRRLAAPYGLVDLATGTIERLVDAPHVPFGRVGRDAGPPVWSPDGRAVLIHTLLPLDQPDAAQTPAQWVEVDIATRRITPLGLGEGWKVVRWDGRRNTLVVRRGSAFTTMARGADGTWDNPQAAGEVEGFSPRYDVATNGRVVIGLKEAPLDPPELAALDLTTKAVTVLTDLNPALRRRRYGTVEEIRWSGEVALKSSGYLIKPVDYAPGKRYPLVILLDDGVMGRGATPFLLDGSRQLSGHAIQMLAASGLMVLYTRTPSTLRDVVETKEEGPQIQDHVESAIAYLDRQRLIDPARVGLSGWSRAGYHTAYVLIHSSHRFAAATKIDGGGREYNDRLRSFHDEELARIRTPLLFEAHGPLSLIALADMSDRLEAMGKPVEVLYFATAPHSTVTPLHRQRSLTAHIDWWRFWLQSYEDPSPAKQAQYERWRSLRSPVAGANQQLGAER